MPRAKIAISLEKSTLRRLDHLVRESVFPNRSRAIQIALDEKIEGLDRSRLARECTKLDPDQEKSMAEEGHSEEPAGWPAY